MLNKEVYDLLCGINLVSSRALNSDWLANLMMVKRELTMKIKELENRIETLEGKKE